MKQELSRQEKRKAWLWAALIVAGMAALAGLIWWGSTWEIWEKKGELPPTSAAVTQAAQGLDSITVDAVLDPEAKQLTATQVMTCQNREGVTLDSVVLRSYSGAYLS